MEARKILSGLCYFSVFFAGLIFPLVVFFASEDAITKGHAKKALLTHLIPLIPMPILVYAIIHDVKQLHAIAHDARQLHDQFPFFTVITAAVIILIIVIVTIWNIIKGVKVFREE